MPIANIYGTNSCKSYSGIIRTIEGATGIKIVCGMNGKSGVALFDDIKVSFMILMMKL